MTDLKPFEISSRRDPKVWFSFLFGLIFFAAGLLCFGNNAAAGGFTLWLICGFFIGIGGFFAVWAGWHLAADTRRGCRIDPETGDLIWWKNRTATHDGRSGRIHPARISRVVIRSHSGDDPPMISLHDLDGQRQPWFDEWVLPSNVEGWARALVVRYPHIRLDRSR